MWKTAQAEVAGSGTTGTLSVKGTRDKPIIRVRVSTGIQTIGPGDADITESNGFGISPGDDTAHVAYRTVQGTLDFEYKHPLRTSSDLYINYTTQVANCIITVDVEIAENRQE